MNQNPFIYSPEEYHRDINVINGYLDQQSFYLSKMSGTDIETVKGWLKDKLTLDETFKLKNPNVFYLSREGKKDRYKAQDTLLGYLDRVGDADYPMAPTFTVYLPEEERINLYKTYIQNKKKERKHHKKLMFKARMDNNEDEAASQNNHQQTKKYRINSLSGAALNPYTISFTSSLHPTLTSVCRISTSYANANNEKFMMSNRTYFSEEITLDNIVLLAMSADKAMIEQCNQVFNIKYPSVEEALECVRNSSDNYWSKNRDMPSILEFLQTCEPYELANIVYNGDLYQLARLNDVVIREFIRSFIHVPRTPTDDAEMWLEKRADEHTISYISLLCSDLLIGKQLSKVKEEQPEVYKIIGGVCKATYERIEASRLFIETYLRPDYLPPEAWDIEILVRKAVITSDTDSTIFTTQEWTKFVTGSYNFEDESYKTGYFMTYLSSQMTIHVLAMMSRNIGLRAPNLRGISMKSEYYFPAYVITPSSKHYYAVISAQEGNVYPEIKLEVKGVNLRNSKIPKTVMEPFTDQLKHVLTTIMKNAQLSLEDVIAEPLRIEQMVKDSLLSGSAEYLTTQQLKSHQSYAKGYDAANYKYHEFWQEVFAPKYGNSPDLPYTGIKVSTILNNRTKLMKWVDSMEDKALAHRIAVYLRNNNKTSMGTIYVPKTLFLGKSLPKELVDVIDIRSLLSIICAPCYLYLESMGFYFKNGANSRLITDEFTKTA